MENKSEFNENFLNTEGGMFQLEIIEKIKEAEDFVDISTIDDEVKEKCREILKKLVQESVEQRDKISPIDLCRNAITQLIDILNQKDEEQNQLFEAIKGVIYKARNSVLGWKDPKK